MTANVSNHRFGVDVPAALRTAECSPVMITDHGWPSHVLLTVEEFDRLSGDRQLIKGALWRGRTRPLKSTCPSARPSPSGASICELTVRYRCPQRGKVADPSRAQYLAEHAAAHPSLCLEPSPA